MDKRYQVFISSTFVDFKEERKEIIERLLNAKYIPAGMEMFSASNEEQFEYIKKIIDTCDYYVLIVGARYGSINPKTGKSFTEQEYDYAIGKGIPVLTFLHNDPYNLPVEKREDEKRDLLETFRKKVSSGRLCKMWNSSSELITSVIISLGEEVANNPQMGWTRISTGNATDLLSQLNTLRDKYDKLQDEYDGLKEKYNELVFEPMSDNIASGIDVFEIIGEIVSNNPYIYESEKVKIECTWDEIFSAVGPYLFVEQSYDMFKYYFRESIKSTYDFELDDLNENCVQTVKIQLSALGLLEIKLPNNGKNVEAIVITEKGKRYLMEIKTVKK